MFLQFLGHAAFLVRNQGTEVLIDPFLEGNPQALSTFKDYSPAYIALTHAHSDHYGDSEKIAKSAQATLIGSFEIATHFAQRGLKSFPMNIGGSSTFPFGKLTYTPAWHSNSFPDGSYAGMPAGIVIEDEKTRLYHAGDTALFSDMALIARKGITVACLPIGDTLTMGPEDALEAVKILKPKLVIPIHYNTFPAIEQDAEAFKRAVESETESEVVMMQTGDSIEV